MPKVVILIPSRYSASRLPGKPLLKVKGIPLIAHVYKKAKETKIRQVYVVTGLSLIHISEPTRPY